MKTRPSKSLALPRKTIGMIACFCWALLMYAQWAMASAPAKDTPEEPIKITADKLVTDNTVQTAEFSGNVRAVQGDTEVIADRLKLFYGAKTGAVSETASSNIERIEAYGQVRISFDNKVAVGDQAIYITKERKLILQGPGSKVISGQNEIAGSKITFYRNDGRVILNRDAENQVKAIIHSDQRGLN